MAATAATRAAMALGGVLLALAAVLSPLYCPGLCVEMRELFPLSVVASIILASYLIGEALGIVPAILEILLGFAAALAGIEATETIETLALMGSVFLMFAAGTEIDVRLLRRHLAKSLAVGLASFAAPFATASAAVYAIGYGVEESLLAGIGVSTTSVAVVYAIIRGLGVSRREEGQVVLASAMAADVASIVAFILLVVEPSPLLAVYLAALLLAPPAVDVLFRRVPQAVHEPEIRLLMALLLAVALFSEAVGVHAILFAFILGAALSEALHIRYPLPEKMSGLVFGFLSPVFFVAAGLHIGPAGLDPRLLVLAPLILAASFPVKILATHAALSRMAGIRDKRLSIVFGARLTVSTIIAYAGLKTGSLAPELAAAVMLTALAATVAAGLAAGWRLVEESLEIEEDIIIPTD